MRGIDYSKLNLPDNEDEKSFWESVAGAGKVGLNAVFDTLSAPSRLIAGTVDDLANDRYLDALNVFDNALDRDNDPSKLLNLDGIAGLAVDIAADPVTWIPGAGFVKGASAASKAAMEATKGISSMAGGPARSMVKKEIVDHFPDAMKQADDAGKGVLGKQLKEIDTEKADLAFRKGETDLLIDSQAEALKVGRRRLDPNRTESLVGQATKKQTVADQKAARRDKLKERHGMDDPDAAAKARQTAAEATERRVKAEEAWEVANSEAKIATAQSTVRPALDHVKKGSEKLGRTRSEIRTRTKHSKENDKVLNELGIETVEDAGKIAEGAKGARAAKKKEVVQRSAEATKYAKSERALKRDIEALGNQLKKYYEDPTKNAGKIDETELKWMEKGVQLENVQAKIASGSRGQISKATTDVAKTEQRIGVLGRAIKALKKGDAGPENLKKIETLEAEKSVLVKSVGEARKEVLSAPRKASSATKTALKARQEVVAARKAEREATRTLERVTPDSPSHLKAQEQIHKWDEQIAKLEDDIDGISNILADPKASLTPSQRVRMANKRDRLRRESKQMKERMEDLTRKREIIDNEVAAKGMEQMDATVELMKRVDGDPKFAEIATERMVRVEMKDPKTGKVMKDPKTGKVMTEMQKVVDIDNAMYKQAYIAVGMPFGPKMVFRSGPMTAKKAAVAQAVLDKLPAGSMAYKAFEAAVDTYIETTGKVGDLFGEAFSTTRKMNPLAYYTSRMATGLANSRAKVVSRNHQKLVNKLNPKDEETLTSFLKKIDDQPVDPFTKEGRKKLADENPKILKEYDSLSDNAREWLNYTHEAYKKYGVEMTAAGILEHGTRSGHYMPRMKDWDKALDAGESGAYITSRMASTVHSAKGIAKERVAKDAAEELLDPFQAFDRYIHQAESLLASRAATEAIVQKAGITFKSAEEAAESGFSKPANSNIARHMDENVYLPDQVVDSLKRLEKVYADQMTLTKIGAVAQGFTARYRTLAYTVSPGRLLIDTVGDIFNSVIAGVNWFNPARTTNAFKIGRQIEKYMLGELPGDTMVKLAGQDVPLKELAAGAASSNLLSVGRTAEATGQNFRSFNKVVSAANPRRAARKYSEVNELLGKHRDNGTRLTGFILATEQELKLGRPLSDSILEGGMRIKGAVFDYSELTAFEQKVMRNIIPFYTWMRKNIPFQAQHIVRAPWMATNVHKVQDQSFESSGLEQGMVPEYLRGTGFGLPGLNTGESHKWAINPMIPISDLGQFQSFRTGAEAGMAGRMGLDINQAFATLNPGIRAFAELSAGRTFFTKKEIENVPGYLIHTFGGQLGGMASKYADPRSSTETKAAAVLGFGTGLRVKPIDVEKAQTHAEYMLRDIKMNEAGQDKRDAMGLNWYQKLLVQ